MNYPLLLMLLLVLAALAGQVLADLAYYYGLVSFPDAAGGRPRWVGW